MNYFSNVKKAFQFTLKHKYLWILGILAALTEGGGFNFNSGYNFNSQDTEKLKNWWQNSNSPITPASTHSASHITNAQVLGSKITNCSDTASNWLNTNSDLLVILMIILGIAIVISLFIIFISFCSKTGLIWATSQIDKNKSANFSNSFSRGYKVFWKTLGLEVIISLIALAIILLFILPIIYSITFEVYVLAIIWAAILILPIIISFLFLNILRQYSLRFIALYGSGISKSIKDGYYLIWHKLKETILIWLISIGMSLVIGLALGLCLFVIILILALLGIGIYYIAHKIGVIIFAVIIGLILFVALIIISGIIHSIISSFWTLSFLDLKAKN